jgi:pimeloyl-ACP methyl ester carboxylesterase
MSDYPIAGMFAGTRLAACHPLRYDTDVYTLLLVSGPPVSAPLWDDVVTRLAHHGQPVQVLDLFDPLPTDPSVAGLARRIGEQVDSIDGSVVLVAHGTAVPVAWHLATTQDLAGLVLTNGPINSLDPFLGTFCRLAKSPRFLASTLLRPGLLQRWLASSAGLRRTVVNPYVMDRDMVVAVSRSYLRSSESRLAVAHFLKDLPQAVSEPRPIQVPTLLLWGDEDQLYPPTIIDSIRHLAPQSSHERISGGKHHHPTERPWEIADRIAAWTPSG